MTINLDDIERAIIAGDASDHAALVLVAELRTSRSHIAELEAQLAEADSLIDTEVNEFDVWGAGGETFKAARARHRERMGK